MARQYLESPANGGPVEVVRRLCGVQTQVTSAAEMVVAVRQPQAQRRDLARALRERAVIKTWAMRGALHLLPVDVAGAYLALIAAGKSWERSSWQKAFISTRRMNALIETVREILDDRVVSREELVAEVQRRTSDALLVQHLRSGWGAILKPLAWQGLLCHGPGAGNRVSFASPARWVPGWRGIPAVDEAARTAIPAYLNSYGPASMEAFDAWLTRGASSKAAVRGWLAAVGDQLTAVDIEGHEAFACTEDVDQIARTRPSSTVRLLPAFDQYVLGPGTSDTRILSAERRSDVSRAAGWITPVVVAGGRVVGTWQTRGGTLEVTLFKEARPLGSAVLEVEAARMAALLDKELTLVVDSK
jgi:hypothetical protein